MRFKLFFNHSSLLINLFKPDLLQTSRLKSFSDRFSSSLLLSSSCASSKVNLKFVPLFSQSSSQSKLNLSNRFYCKYSYYDDSEELHQDIVYENLTIDKYRKLVQGKDDEQLIKEILSVYEYIKFDTGEVPSTIKINQMSELMKITPDGWTLTFKFLSNKEKFIKSKKLKNSDQPKSPTYIELQKLKDDGQQPLLGLNFDPETGAPLYGEWLNSHFIRLSRYDYRCSFVPNLLASYLFEQRLIIDCDYDYTVIEAKNLAHDIQKAFAINRSSTQPFNLTLTGLKSPLLRDLLDQYFVSFNSNNGNLGIDTYSESFIELFSDQKLIYLSPHSKTFLTEYDDDAIYILGGLTPKVLEPLSFKKSVAAKIPSYRFPTGTIPFRAMRNAKCFDLTESTKIMLNFKESRDIADAVKNGIRSGRLKTQEEIEKEQKYRLNKLLVAQRRIKKSKPITR